MRPNSSLKFQMSIELHPRDLFENNVRAALADPEVCLRINVAVDTV